MRVIQIILIISILINGISAKDFIVDQKNKQFSLKILNIKVGDVVHFRNSDPFFHNVYSLDPLKTFDLGYYPAPKSKAVIFDKPGEFEIKCAIHPNMKIIIKVE